MATNATIWREYLRGREPGDWYHLFRTGETWPLRSVDGDSWRAGWLAQQAVAAREVLAWAAADTEPDIADCETLSQHALTAMASANTGVIRASGAAGAENGYYVNLNPVAGTMVLFRWIAGVNASLGSTPVAGLRPFCPVWVRLRGNGTSITAHGWVDGETEPTSGDGVVAVGDSSHATGALGIARSAAGTTVETYFFSYATGGDVAPGPESIPAGIASWALDSDSQIELTAELEVYDPLSQNNETVLVSTRGRYTDARDYPAAAEMPPLLLDAGALTIRLAEDLLFGAAEQSLGRVQFLNARNQLSYLLDRTASGRKLTVRAGLAGWESHRWFEPIYTALVEGEPAVDDTVDITLQAPDRMLEQNLAAGRYVGIPTCLALDGAGHEAPHVASYDLTRLLLSYRFAFDTTPAVDTGLTKSTSLTADNFSLFVEAGTGAVVARASSGGVSSVVTLRSAAGINYADGSFHLAALGIDETSRAYLVVDGAIVAEMEPSGAVDTPTAAISLFGWDGGRIFDIRLLAYCPAEEEVQSLLAARPMGDDPGAVGLWLCDDGLGDEATDYSPTANNIALAGTVNVNYTWTATSAGEEEQAGSQIQIAAGAVFNAPALLIDRNRQRFRLSDGALPGVVTVRSKAEVIATWTDVGDGVIEFPDVTSEPVTFDHGATVGADDNHLRLATVLEELMSERMGLDESTYDPIATRALNAILPHNVSFFTDQEMTQAQAMQTLLAGLAHYRQDRDGRLLPGVVLPPVSPGPVPGEAVLEFLGTEGRSRVSWATTTGDVPDGPFAIAFWVKTFARDRWTVLGDESEAFPSYAAIASNISPDAGGYYIGLYRAAAGSIGFRFPWLAGVYFVMPAGTIDWGVWTFCACRWDGITIRLYAGKQGGQMVEVFRTLTTGTQFAAAQGLDLGGRWTELSQGSLWGSIAHYQVYNTAKSVGDLQAVMDAGSQDPADPDLLFYAPISEGAGRQAMDLVSASSGTIWGCRWAPRMVFDFRAGFSRAKVKAKRLRPAWDGIVEWLINYKPLQDADIAAPVSAADAAARKRASRRDHAPSSTVRAAYRDAREVNVTTALVDREAARQTARDIRFRFDPGRIQAALADAPRAALALQPGDEIWIYYPRIGSSQGAAVRVVGITPSLRTLRTALDLWGDRLPLSEAAILVGEMSALATDDGDLLTTD